MTMAATRLTGFVPLSLALHAGLILALVHIPVFRSGPSRAWIRVHLLPPHPGADVPEPLSRTAKPPELSVTQHTASGRARAPRTQAPRPHKSEVPLRSKGPRRPVRQSLENAPQLPALDTGLAAGSSLTASQPDTRGSGTGSDTGGGGAAGGDGLDLALQNYLALVRALIDAHKHYPEEARRANRQGTAVVAFVVSPAGDVRNVRLVSADDVALGTAALRALKQAARRIGPPPTGTAIPMEIAVHFHLAAERSQR